MTGRRHDAMVPAPGGGAQALVTAARRHLDMDLAFVAEFAGGRRVFRFLDAVPGAVHLDVGDSDLLADTYCEKIVRGEIPEVIPDTKREAKVAHLPVTDQLGIGSYIGVPVRYPNGELFGTRCCLSHVTRPDLGGEHRRYLAVLAETLAAELVSDAGESASRTVSRARIERVIADAAFHPVYQPIVELRTGRVVGAEALTRFGPDDRGPLAWFAEAATVGLGIELELATATAALDRFAAESGVYLAVNASPLALDGVLELVTQSGVDPTDVVVELTEHAEVVDDGVLLDKIDELRSRSLRIAVDDTGAGVSSLRHILELRPEIIKLDLTLTIGIDTDPVRQALARALAEFGERMGAAVIAEGIETPDQLRTVADLGIELVQGFHLGRPGPLPLPSTVPEATIRG